MSTIEGGRCCYLVAGEFTRDDLIAQGLPPAAADELVAFADKLIQRATARSANQETLTRGSASRDDETGERR